MIKMGPFAIAGCKSGWLFSLGLLLLAAVHVSIVVNGQQVGVSLQLRGEIVPNNSLFNLDDLQYHTDNNQPTNANGQQTLMCVTDLKDCCDTEQLGNWYYPDGRTVVYNTGGATFQRNRGQNETIGSQNFYGSVRLWRRYTPTERGLFRCELQDAENVVQNLYVNILYFTRITGSTTVSVTISPSGSTTAGETYSLTCSATLNPNRNPPLPDPNIPSPTFEWFFGPNGNDPLPFASMTTPATNVSGGTYTSTLQFSPLGQSHEGMYTCRLGAGSLVNSAMVTVNAPALSVQITTSGTPMLGQSNSLTCSVSGAENLNPSITYQWTKNNGTQTQIQNQGPGADPKVLSFSPLRLSDAGRYNCQATISSPYLNNNITVNVTEDVMLQIPAPISIMLSSSISSPILPFGSDVTLICTVLLISGPRIDVPLNVNFELLRMDPARSPLTISVPSVSGSTYNTTAMINSFTRNDSGNYTCRATARSASTNTYIRDSNTESDSVRVTTGVYLVLGGMHITNGSNVNIKRIGQSSENALQCITDRTPCCFSSGYRFGEWYLPNRTLVQGTTSTTAFYRNRGDNGEVSLNRPSDVMSPTGLFCCEVPDATDTNQKLCVNIGGLSITTSGSAIAGESYTLECSAGGSDGTFQWLKGPPDGGTPVIENNPRVNIISNATTSQLQFQPIGQSDNGSYSCSATVGGLNLSSEPVTISVNAPSVSVQISDGVATPTAGENHQLTCNVSGTEGVNPTMTYKWTKANDTTQTQVGTNSNTLSFTPLRLSDAANYTCKVTVDSSYLSGAIVAMSANAQDVRIQIPTPSSLTLTNSGTSDVVVVGSDVTLTCTLVLNSAIVATDLPLLMVGIQLSKDGTPLSNRIMSSMRGTTFTYTTQLELNSFGRNNSGKYTCTATVSPQPTSTYLNGTITLPSSNIRVTTGVYLSLNRQPYRNNSDILINEIGERMEGGGVGEALLCYTDNTVCCNITGQWLLPSGADVGDASSGTGDFYISRGDSVIRLHRRNNTFSTGIYCCVVPDARSQNTRTCANIVSPSTDSAQQGMIPAIAGGVVAGLAVMIILVVMIMIIILFLRRRSSSKPYEVSKTKATVMYSKQKNGDQLFGVGINKEPKFVDFPSDTNITEGEGVYFKIKVSGEPQPTVTWYHDGKPIRADYAREVEADGSLAIPSAELKHSGVYKAVAANKHGSEERELKLTVSEEGGESKVDIGETVKSRPIPIPEFGKYVSELHSNSNKPFKDLYEALDSGEQGHSTSYATDPHRKPLNRFGNIVVYDDNRIPLQPLSESKDCQGDYINACYIDGYSIPNKFIATQGPMPKTVVDFWRLIWQEHPPTIIMVTNVKEGTRIKCQRYWPESGQETYGPFHVIITDQQIFADYTVRTLSVSLGSGGRSHKVTQYHFTAWPDHGVPDYATPILAFHRRVKAQHHPSRGPMVVHCSAGVGRTGTFIIIDNILEQIEKEQVVDIPGAITKIRQRRMKMVQTHEQFTFIHDAILESVTCGDTQISATNLRTAIVKLGKKDGFQHQMKVLEQVSPNPDELQCSSARSHPDRNRGDRYLPADRWRIILKGEQPDYIHAVSINGYKHQKAFIIAQGPLQSTVRNFWKMIYDRKSAVIVMVSDLKEGGQEASAQYWPSSGIAQYGEYTVDLLGEEPLQGFTIRTLSVMDKKTQKAHQVTQFHITCWRPDGHCSNLKSVTDVIEEMTKVQIRSGNKPIVVHCSDTVTRSGMFCAIATTIERCKTEGVVDVFQVVKALRVQKPGAVPTVEQYQQIFETVLVFLESFDTYANFQM